MFRSQADVSVLIAPLVVITERITSSFSRRLVEPAARENASSSLKRSWACFTTPSGLGVVASSAPSRPLDVSGTANGAAGYSVLPCIDKEGDDGPFATRF